MKIEKLSHIPGGEHDWYVQIGGDRKSAFCILLRYFTKCGFRLSVNLYTDRLIKLFGFFQKIIGV